MIFRRVLGRVARGFSWVASAKTTTSAFIHTLSARLLLIAINFGTGIIVARNLLPHGRGIQAAISIWPLVIAGLFTLGIPSALRFRIPRDRKRAEELLSTALVFALLLGIVAAGIGFIFVPHWLSQYDAQSIKFAQFILVFVPGSLGLFMVQAFYEATGRFRQSNAIIYIPPLSTLVALLVLAETHTLTPFTSTLAYYIPTSALFTARLYWLRTHIEIPPPRFRENAQALLSYGTRAFGIDILATLSTQIDQALVIRFLSASELGVYAVALAISRLLAHFSTALATVLLPKAAALPASDAIRLVGRSARVTLATTGIAAIALAIVAPIVVPFFYGHDFSEAGRLARILFAEVTLSATITVLAQAFLSTGRPGIVTLFQGIGLAAVIPLMLVMIPRFGLVGVALALLASTSLRLIFVLGCFPAMLRTAPPNMLLTPGDARFIIQRLRAGTANSGA